MVNKSRDEALNISKAMRGGEIMQVQAVVVGAGQAGPAVAGRLKASGISVEKNERVGDNWTGRYESAKRE